MDVKVTENEVFALRHGEVYRWVDGEPASGRWIAVMLRLVSLPDGPRQEVRQRDLVPVEMAAVLACHKVEGRWQWLQLSPATKENIGDLLFDNGASRDVWHFIEIVPQPETAAA